MKSIFVRTAIAALFAIGTVTALSAAPRPDPGQKTPIPICWQCGRGDISK